MIMETEIVTLYKKGGFITNIAKMKQKMKQQTSWILV